MFDNGNIDSKLIHDTLEKLKIAITNYERIYKGKSYKYKFDSRNLSVRIDEPQLNHLLGFDKICDNTWYDYISRNDFGSIDWLRDFAKSEEFLNYYIIARGKDPYINFNKINFKISNFNNFDLKSNTAFCFDDSTPAYFVTNFGIVNDDKVISLKLKNIGNGRPLIPSSIFVYDNNLVDVDNIKNIRFPISARLFKSKRYISLDDLYTECKKEETKEKIKQLIK